MKFTQEQLNEWYLNKSSSEIEQEKIEYLIAKDELETELPSEVVNELAEHGKD